MHIKPGTLLTCEGYVDVTHIFQPAASDMVDGSLIFMDGFSLHDAMSAVEIGEPRLDSGVIRDEERRPRFNPLTPLLPEEVCWIMDHAFAYEMEWHAGNTLARTVFTLLFALCLDDYNPDLISPEPITERDERRPRELITVVLRAFVFGLLKCCDLAWRALVHSVVKDCEDWQSEKNDVSLLEGVSEALIAKQLEDADAWLGGHSKAFMQWQDGIHARLMLRKVLLQLLNYREYHNAPEIHALIVAARRHVQFIRLHPSPAPDAECPLHLAFDPNVTRCLNTFASLRVTKPLAIEMGLRAIEALLDGLDELLVLSATTNLSVWETGAYLRLWSCSAFSRIPWLRARFHAVFFDASSAQRHFQSSWLVDRFSNETVGLSWSALSQYLRASWPHSEALPLTDLERRIQMASYFESVSISMTCLYALQLILSHFRALRLNHPRCRRELAKSLLDWHALYDVVIRITSQLTPPDSPSVITLSRLPQAILVWRLTILREVVLSGFQLHLYSAEEKIFAYWYATQIIEEHLGVLDSLLLNPPEGSANEEMKYQQQFLTALQLMCEAMFLVTLQDLSLSWRRLRLNYMRRYKWAFKPEYDHFKSVPPASPEYSKFLASCACALKDRSYSPVETSRLAKVILLSLAESTGALVEPLVNERKKLVGTLIQVCEKLNTLPPTWEALQAFKTSNLRWDPQSNPWFPNITTIENSYSDIESNHTTLK